MLIATGKKEKLSVSKGSLIEVSSHGKEWHSTLYCAILEEDLGKSKKKKLRVRYLDPLLKQDYSPQSMKIIAQRLIRPVPPLDLFPDVDFEEGDIIDAVYNGRWCTGWVIKGLGNGHYLVYLRSEPGAMEFERKDMRLHLVWEDNEWFRCEKKRLTEPNYNPGAYVEARIEVDNMGDVWAPAKVIKDNEDGTLLVMLRKLCNDKSKDTKISVPYSKIRPSQPEYGYRIYQFMEKVDVYLKTRWCPGVVSKVLSEDKYAVVLEPNKETKEFSCSELRPSVEWKDGLWVREEKAPEETTIREIVNKRKRGLPCKFMSTEPKQKKTGTAATVSKAATSELANMTDDDRPLASLIHGEKTSSGLAGSSAGQSVSRSPEPVLNSVVEKHVDVVETTPPKESTMVLPFVKKSPLWKVLESMEVFKAVSQRPHFTPLLESVEESREGEAIGQVVIYTGLLEKLNNLPVDEPISSINRIDECLINLEKHGFSVTEPRSRIAKILSIKETKTRVLEELKAAEKKITESDMKRRKHEEDIVELQTEFQRQEAVLKKAKVRLDTEIAQKVRLDKEIAQMQSNAAVLNQKVKNVDQELRAIVADPW